MVHIKKSFKNKKIYTFSTKKKKIRVEFPGGPVVKTLLPLSGVRIQSLVGE